VDTPEKSNKSALHVFAEFFAKPRVLHCWIDLGSALLRSILGGITILASGLRLVICRL